MAVTIHQTPASYTPSDNPVTWTFSSDQTAQPNFSYLVEIYINDTLVANETRFPESGIYARFDARDYTSDACNVPPISQDLVINAANYCDVRITITERYGDPIASGASTAATNITAFKARLQEFDFIDWNPSTYIYGSDASWLTNYPTDENPKVRETDESKFLMCINDENNVNILIQLYDSDDVLVASDTYGFAAAAFKILILNLSPATIIADTTITAADFTNSAYFTVSDTLDLEAYRIDIDRDHKYNYAKRLHFLSQLGTVESFSFDLISRTSADINSYSYKRNFGQWNGNQFEYNKERGVDIDYAKTITPKMRVWSNWLTQSEQNYLNFNMLASPLVYEEDGGILIQRKITNKKVDNKIHENDMIFLLVAELDLIQYDSMTL